MPAHVTVTVNKAELRTLMAGPTGGVYQDIFQRGNRVLNRARSLVPVDTGTLRASLTVDMVKGATGLPTARVGSNLHYARYVHDGTGVYAGRGRIYPRSARVLRWPAINNSGSGNRRFKGGQTAAYVFARSIRGMKGTPYLVDALPAAAG